MRAPTPPPPGGVMDSFNLEKARRTGLPPIGDTLQVRLVSDPKVCRRAAEAFLTRRREQRATAAAKGYHWPELAADTVEAVELYEVPGPRYVASHPSSASEWTPHLVYDPQFRVLGGWVE